MTSTKISALVNNTPSNIKGMTDKSKHGITGSMITPSSFIGSTLGEIGKNINHNKIYLKSWVIFPYRSN
jgi:hypothetical protein